jgi:hypothetical protein
MTTGSNVKHSKSALTSSPKQSRAIRNEKMNIDLFDDQGLYFTCATHLNKVVANNMQFTLGAANQG